MLTFIDDIKEKIITNNHQRDTKNFNPVKFHNELVENVSVKYASSLNVNELSKTIMLPFKKHPRQIPQRNKFPNEQLNQNKNPGLHKVS